ncbi:60S ribosomal protein L33A, partial [Modicella reniformis]
MLDSKVFISASFFFSPIWTFIFLVHSLYAKGRVLGFKRAKRNQRPDISLIQIEGVKTIADTEFYLGKRVAFVYRAKREVNGSKIRCIWGRIIRAHGGSGTVKARFRNNLPAKSFGAS